MPHGGQCSSIGAMRPLIAAVLVGAAFAALPSVAFGDDPSVPTAYKLNLEDAPALPFGKSKLIEGVADPAGHRFYVPDLSVLQPVTVSLLTKQESDDVQLHLSKYRWDEFDRTASSKGALRTTFNIRTEGELRIVVRGDEPVPYQLLVFVAEPIEPPMPPLVVSQSAYDEGGAGWIVAVVVGVFAIGGIAGFLIIRRRRNAQ